MEFKDRIKELRLQRALSQTELASIFGKSESAIRMWEVGKSKPDCDTLIKIAEFFHCTPDFLLGISDYMKPEYREFTIANQTFIAELVERNKDNNMFVDIFTRIGVCHEMLEPFLAYEYLDSVRKVIEHLYKCCEDYELIDEWLTHDSYEESEVPLVIDEILEVSRFERREACNAIDNIAERIAYSIILKIKKIYPYNSAHIADNFSYLETMRTKINESKDKAGE